MDFSTIQLVELGLIGVFYLILGFGMLRQWAHVRTVRCIFDEETMNAFRRFVRLQMYTSAAGYALLIPIVLAIIVEGEGFSTLGGFACWVPLGAMIIVSRFTKSLEAQIQNPERCATTMRQEFEEIIFVWRKKLLPTF